ncbi:SRPBCC domain-containing protein [Nocardioides sp. AN3]
MTVVSSRRDIDDLTLAITSELSAPPSRVWQVWADAGQLSRWWGPPTWPATFTRHDFTIEGRSHYYMTGPEGEHAYGAWEVTELEPPHRLAFIDAFADADGAFLDDPAPMRIEVSIEEAAHGSRMTVTTHFDSVEHLQQVADMGMEEGMRQALGQIDDLLAERASV